MKIGNLTHQYEIDEGWGELPEGVEYGYTHGVVVDSEDHVYVHNQSKDAVIVFDRDGRFLTSWGEDFAGGAHGMYLNREDDGEYLYLTDLARHTVVKLTLGGKVIFTLETPDLPEVYDSVEKYLPTDVAVAPNGDIFVCDGYGQSWVHRYNAGGEWIGSWGGRGSEPGKMACPHGIFIDTRGPQPTVYVADRENHRIQVFTQDGEHLRFITADIDFPCGFYPFQNELYIPDLHSRLTILDENDQLITHLGEDPEAWQKEGWPNRPISERQIDKFISPHAACVDSHGDIYVVEWVSDGRLTKLIRKS